MLVSFGAFVNLGLDTAVPIGYILACWDAICHAVRLVSVSGQRCVRPGMGRVGGVVYPIGTGAGRGRG